MTLMRVFAWLVVAPGLLVAFLLIAYLMWPMALLIVAGMVWAWLRRLSGGRRLQAA